MKKKSNIIFLILSFSAKSATDFCFKTSIRMLLILSTFFLLVNCYKLSSEELEITTHYYYGPTTENPSTTESSEHDIILLGSMSAIAIIGMLIFATIAFCLGCGRCACSFAINQNQRSGEYEEI